MTEKAKEIVTVSDKIIKIFIDKLSSEKGFDIISARLEKAISNNKVSESMIRSALFDEEIL